MEQHIYDCVVGGIERLASRWSSSSTDYDDLRMEGLCGAVRASKRYEGKKESELVKLCGASARNAMANWRSKHVPVPDALSPRVCSQPGPEVTAYIREIYAILRARLSARQRQILDFRLLGDSYSQIAKRTKMSAATVSRDAAQMREIAVECGVSL